MNINKTATDVDKSTSRTGQQPKQRRSSPTAWTPPPSFHVVGVNGVDEESKDDDDVDDKIKHAIDSVLQTNYKEKKAGASSKVLSKNGGGGGGVWNVQGVTGRPRIGPPTRRDSYSTVSTGPAEREILQNTRMEVKTRDERRRTSSSGNNNKGNTTRGGGGSTSGQQRRFIPLEIIIYTTGPAVKNQRQQQQQQNHSFAGSDGSKTSTSGNRSGSRSGHGGDGRQHLPRLQLQKARSSLPDSRNIMDVYGEDDADIIFVPSSSMLCGEGEGSSVTSSVMEVPQHYMTTTNFNHSKKDDDDYDCDDDDDDYKITRVEI
jgi:hypothetical protein